MRPTVNIFALHNADDSSFLRDAVARFLDRRGFDLLAQLRVEHGQLCHLALLPVQGPAELPTGEYDVFITVDLDPMPGGADGEEPVPGLDNGRLRYLGRTVHNAEAWVGARVGRDGPRSSVRIWYTPTGEEGWRAVRHLGPGMEQSLKLEIEERAAAMTHHFQVVRPLTHFGICARTDLVELGGRLGVCKVFRPGRERYFANELAVCSLAESIGAIPPILEVGSNWVVLPYYSDHQTAREAYPWVPQWGRRLMPLPVARRFVDAVVELHEAGYAHLDLHGGHVLIGPRGDVKLIDFEKLHRVEKGSSLFTSPMIAGYGVTDDLDGRGSLDDFDTRFRHLLGAGLEVFVSGSTAEQIAQRTLFRGRSFVKRLEKRAGRMRAALAR
jgi:hypothetical protein